MGAMKYTGEVTVSSMLDKDSLQCYPVVTEPALSLSVSNGGPRLGRDGGRWGGGGGVTKFVHTKIRNRVESEYLTAFF